jgi:hypothetical protein
VSLKRREGERMGERGQVKGEEERCIYIEGVRAAMTDDSVYHKPQHRAHGISFLRNLLLCCALKHYSTFFFS